MAVALQDRKRATGALKSWLDDIAAYESAFKKWETRVESIHKRYRDENRVGISTDASKARFNILWANVQTLTAATFSRLPKPDVSRRFRDSDPVGRVAALILERALEFEVQHYPFYRTTLKADVQDRFLGGRGTAWVRYEPHVGPQDDVQITDTSADNETQEELQYECTPVDYVHWRDFGHTVARTWPEVKRVWRRVYMGKGAIEERFGKEIAAAVPMDATPEDLKRQDGYKQGSETDAACIFEGWDIDRREAVWFNKGVKDFLDLKPDPLHLEQFFPCARPLYATLTNETLVPVPDFTLYQDQANELDLLADKIDGLIKALKVTGVYDASQGTVLSRLFTEGDNNSLLPVKNWAAFAEKNGLKGAIDLVDITMISAALKDAYLAFEQVKGQIYEITGIADIVRGDTDPNETLGAQELKSQYINMRLLTMQEDVARYATEVLRIMAEIICTNYQPQTLLAISSAAQLAQEDLPHVSQAIMMLKNEPLRNFRIEVAADSLVQLDENQEKEQKVEFLRAVGSYFKDALPVAQASPPAIPLIMSLLRFGVRGFKIGKTVEGSFDEFDQQMRSQAQQPKPPDPEMMKMDQELKAKQAEHEQTLAANAQQHQQKLEADRQSHEQKMQMERERMQHEFQTPEDMKALASGMYEMQNTQGQSMQGAIQMLQQVTQELAKVVAQMAQASQQVAQAAQVMVGPRKVVRGPDGRITHSVPDMGMMQ